MQAFCLRVRTALPVGQARPGPAAAQSDLASCWNSCRCPQVLLHFLSEAVRQAEGVRLLRCSPDFVSGCLPILLDMACSDSLDRGNRTLLLGGMLASGGM